MMVKFNFLADTLAAKAAEVDAEVIWGPWKTAHPSEDIVVSHIIYSKVGLAVLECSIGCNKKFAMKARTPYSSLKTESDKYMQMIDTVWWHDCFQYQKTVEPVNFGPKPTIVNYAVDSEECIKTICQSSVTSLSSCMSSIFQDNHDQLLHVVAFILLNYEPSSNYDFASSSMHQNTTNFFYDLFLFASLVLVDDDSCAGVISNYLRYYGIYAQWYEMDTKSLFAHHYYKKIVLFVFKYLQDNLTLSRQRSIQVDMVKYLDKFLNQAN
jgi:hypothetical protein